MYGQELDSVMLIGLFLLRIFYELQPLNCKYFVNLAKWKNTTGGIKISYVDWSRLSF